MAYDADKKPSELTALTSLDDTDTVIVGDTSDASEVVKAITWLNIKGAIQTYVEGLASYFNVSTDDSDAITQGATNLFLTSAERSKLTGIETSADVTDATNVAAAGAVMADGSGSDITGDLVFTEKADHSSTPGAGKGYLWVKNTGPSTLIFTNDAGTDTTLGSGGGSGDMAASTYDPASVSEQLVGLTATQTLTNKTLTTPTLTLKQSTTPTPTAEGDIQWDTDNDRIVVGDGAGQKTFSDDASNASTYAAASHNHAASEITSGTLAHERGGLEADVSAYSGLLKISGGATSQAVADTDYLTPGTAASTYQPLDSDLTTIAAANNGSVLAATTASFTTADETKLDGIETAADVTDTANVTAAGALMDSELTDIVAVKALADGSASDVNTGTSTTLFITPDALAGSNLGTKSVGIQVTDGSGAIATGDGQAYFRIPTSINGMNLVAVAASLTAPSTSGTPTIQIARGRQAAAGSAHAFVDMLSTAITIDANEYDSKDATTAAVINGSNDDVATGDLIRVDVDGVGSGPTAVLSVNLEFRLP